jgi:hypothetical protein
MSEAAKIILTALATIIGGVIVYVAGQLVSKLVLDPLQQQRKVIGDIHVGLVVWARDWANLVNWPGGRTEERDTAQKAFRDYAGQLIAATSAIPQPLYGLARRLGAPRPDDVRLAARDLIGLSNNLYSDDDTRREHERIKQERVAAIRERLRLWVDAGERPIERPIE